MKLSFLGATGTVTGSKYLIEDDNKKILIDCGLFQGAKELRLRNWGSLPVAPVEIDAVVLTHAHLDHSGYIPLLVRDGFRGPIYCSESTLDLCRILLPDSGFLQEEDAARANRHGYSRHAPALPLYTERDARACLDRFRAVSFGAEHGLSDFLGFSLHRAGHILGASFIRISDGSTSILFSGDIGRLDDPVMKPPVPIEQADYLVVESTYGNRVHDRTDPLAQLETIIGRTIGRGGSVVIPAFAVGRAQSLLYYLYRLKSEKRLPMALPVYLDSPMAINTSDLMHKHLNDHRLTEEMCVKMGAAAEYTRTTEESRAIDARHNGMPRVVISASGMATGGRVLHHLKHCLGDARNTVLLTGYQAEGTRGDRLARGEKEIKIHGAMYPVRAEVVQLDNMSAHADSEEILTWLRHFRQPPRKTFVTHGSPESARALREKIESTLGWRAEVPQYLQKEEL